MPELPEVETIKRYLDKAIIGQKVLGIKILSKKQFPGNPKDVIDEKITAVYRRGKNLIIELSGNKALLCHLKLTGQFIWWPGKNKAVFKKPIPFNGQELPGKTTRVIIKLSKGNLFFNDLRKFGWIKILTNSEKQLTDNLAKLGPEPFSKDFNNAYLQNIFLKTSKPIKLVLLDQEKIAGIGNIYANEALFLAKINPQKPAKNLKPDDIQRLRKAVLRVLEQGIKYGGSSASDEAYIRPDASQGSYQQHFKVYQKQGQKCPRCKNPIKRVDLGGRGTFFCPKCQN